jgi:hypothetical protein
MRWTSVAWVCCLLPVLAGCGTTSRVTWAASGGSVTNEAAPVHARRAVGEESRRGASVAWEAVRAQHARRPFSDEFREGFADGYADFVELGDRAQPPAVPPVSYARYQKYFGPEGHGLVRDYYLGFDYGIEVAGAIRRPAPVLPTWSGVRPAEPATRPGAAAPPKPETPPPPRPLPEPGKVGEPKKGSDSSVSPPAPVEGGKEAAVPPLPKPEVPVIKPFNPDLSGGKFTPIPVPSEPDRLPAPYPPLPVSAPLVSPIPVPSDAPKAAPPVVIPPAVAIPVATIPPAR